MKADESRFQVATSRSAYPVVAAVMEQLKEQVEAKRRVIAEKDQAISAKDLAIAKMDQALVAAGAIIEQLKEALRLERIRKYGK